MGCSVMSVSIHPTYKSYHKGKDANTVFQPSGGLSLRDYFAAKAMAAMITGDGNNICNLNVDSATRNAYKLADAMIEQRSK